MVDHVAFNRSQQFADSLGLGNSGAVLYLQRSKRATQLAGGVVFGASGGDGISEYLACAAL